MQNKEKYKGKFRIKSNRLENYDYSQNGAYFVTICTKYFVNYFGRIENGKMILNEIGEIVLEEILFTENLRENIKIDKVVIMPDHIHLIIFIENTENVETDCNLSLPGKSKFGGQINILGKVIRGMKGKLTKRINSKYEKFNFSWQPNYHDKIIRNDEDLNNTRKYILENPLKHEFTKQNIFYK